MPRRTVPFDRILAPGHPVTQAARGAAYREPAEDAYDGTLNPGERDAVFEIAALMATVSGPLSLDEANALGDLVSHLQGEAASMTDVGQLLRAAERRRGKETVEERVRGLASVLKRRVVRELAYKAAYAIRVCDLEANDAEADLDALLVETLDIADSAGELASQVNEALMD